MRTILQRKFLWLLVCLFNWGIVHSWAYTITISGDKCVMFVGSGCIGKLELTPGTYTSDTNEYIPAKLEIPDNFEAIELRYGNQVVSLTGLDLNNLLLPIDSKLQNNIRVISACIRPKPIQNAKMLVEVLNSYRSENPRSNAYPQGTSFQSDPIIVSELVNGEVSIIDNMYHPRDYYYDTSGSIQRYQDQILRFNGEPIRIKAGVKDGSFVYFEKIIDGADITISCPVSPCLVKAGSLTIDGGWNHTISLGSFPIFILDGANAEVTIKDGYFENGSRYVSEQGPMAVVKQGTLNISGGYLGEINMFGGELNVSGGYFHSNIDNPASINILAPCKVSLSGGRFDDESGSRSPQSVFIDSSVSMKNEDLLVEGYDFYSSYPTIRPAVKMEPIETDIVTEKGFTIDNNNELVETTFTGRALYFEQVKSKEVEHSLFFEAAQNANVGPSGTDVSIEGNEYLIKSEEGLAWVAYMLNNIEFENHSNKNYESPMTNGREYFFKSNNIPTYFRLTKSMDMAKYDWIPFALPTLSCFDGQGYCIRGLNMESGGKYWGKYNQLLVGFISYTINGILSNLSVEGVAYIQTKHFSKESYAVGGLIGYNHGLIVNCSFVGDLSCDAVHDSGCIIGGLVGENDGQIENSSMVGSIYLNVEEDEYLNYYGANTTFCIGGLVGRDLFGGKISNCCYMKDDLPESITVDNNVYKYQIMSDDFVGYYNTLNVENCYLNLTSTAEINQNVENHNMLYPKADLNTFISMQGGGYFMKWDSWSMQGISNIIHGSYKCGGGSTIIESYFTLRAEGEGEFKATYYTLKDETDPESQEEHVIYADTTVTFSSAKTVKLIAIPAEGYELEKVVKVSGEKETPLNVEFIPGEEVNYNVVVSDTLKAYFKEKEAEPIASKFTILKEGSGEFKATYTYLKDINDPNSAVDTIIYANTFVEVINNEDFTITATPSEGYELDRVVKILNGEEVDTLDMKVGEPLEYNVVASDTLKAYFKEIELIPEEPEIITTDSILTSDQVNGDSLIVAGGTATDTLELNVSNISIPSLTINANSVVSLSISGDNNLGKIENKGTLVIQNNDGNLDVEIENKGIFIDYTGTITKVSSFSINSIDDETVKEGETVTLTASVSSENVGDNIEYKWQRFINNAWKDVEVETIQTRAAIVDDKPNELIVPSSETGAYRCLITYTNEEVSTTLTAYAEVSLDASAPEDPDEDTDEPDDSEDTSRPDDTPTYYNVKVDDVCEGVEVQLSNTVVKEGNQINVYIKVIEGYDAENLKVYFKQSPFNYWEEVKEGVQPGEYIIYNVWADISIKVEGAVKEEPTGIDHLEGVKVYAKDGSIYVYTPNREEVVILNMTGVIVKSEEQVGLVQYDGLERGIYIIRIGDNVFKIKN